MRFFEYEAREIVKRAGIPVTDFGFTTDAAEAQADRAAHRRPHRHQVPGAHRRAHEGRRREVRRHARGGRGSTRADILELEINGHQPRGVLVDPKAEVEQEYYAGVVWDGIRKQPVIIFSPVGGIDIEQVAEEQPDKVGRRHFSNILPFSEFAGQGGHRLHRRDRLGRSTSSSRSSRGWRSCSSRTT